MFTATTGTFAPSDLAQTSSAKRRLAAERGTARERESPVAKARPALRPVKAC